MATEFVLTGFLDDDTNTMKATNGWVWRKLRPIRHETDPSSVSHASFSFDDTQRRGATNETKELTENDDAADDPKEEKEAKIPGGTEVLFEVHTLAHFALARETAKRRGEAGKDREVFFALIFSLLLTLVPLVVLHGLELRPNSNYFVLLWLLASFILPWD